MTKHNTNIFEKNKICLMIEKKNVKGTNTIHLKVVDLAFEMTRLCICSHKNKENIKSLFSKSNNDYI